MAVQLREEPRHSLPKRPSIQLNLPFAISSGLTQPHPAHRKWARPISPFASNSNLLHSNRSSSTRKSIPTAVLGSTDTLHDTPSRPDRLWQDGICGASAMSSSTISPTVFPSLGLKAIRQRGRTPLVSVLWTVSTHASPSFVTATIVLKPSAGTWATANRCATSALRFGVAASSLTSGAIAAVFVLDRVQPTSIQKAASSCTKRRRALFWNCTAQDCRTADPVLTGGLLEGHPSLSNPASFSSDGPRLRQGPGLTVVCYGGANPEWPFRNLNRQGSRVRCAVSVTRFPSRLGTS
jgi:hypothetical protein